MSLPGTSKLVLDSLTRIAPRYRDIRGLADFQRVFPFRTVRIDDGVSKTFEPLPKGYAKHRLYVMDGSVQLASINLAFSADSDLVNFSMLVIPHEWFKRRAVMKCARNVVLPFIREHYPDAMMVPQFAGVYLFPDPASGLTIQLRAHTEAAYCLGIGVAIIDSAHV